MTDEKDGLVRAEVLVPRERLSEFYVMVGRWLARAPVAEVPGSATAVVGKDDEPASGASNFSGDRNPDSWPLTPWKAFAERRLSTAKTGEQSWLEGRYVERLVEALLVYNRLSSGAKKIIDALIDLMAVPISGDALSEQLDLPGSQLTGTLASAGIRSKAVNREVPFRYEPGPNGGRYWIEGPVMALFDWARMQPEELYTGAITYETLRRHLREDDPDPSVVFELAVLEDVFNRAWSEHMVQLEREIAAEEEDRDPNLAALEDGLKSGMARAHLRVPTVERGG